MSRRRTCSWLVLAVVLATGCASAAPRELRSPANRFPAIVALPTPDTMGAMPLDEAISRRRSQGEFRSTPLPLALIGQLLWAGQGITSADGKRTAPSAGGLYPIELYVVTDDQVMHYLPDGHRVEVRASNDRRDALGAATLSGPTVSNAPAVVVVGAIPSRTRIKYGARADAFVALEAGHVTQNILLEATEHSLAAVPIGGLDQLRVRRVLALPHQYVIEYLVPVGYPRA